MSFTIAQLTDVHLGPLPELNPWDWNVKRAMGLANWKRRRKRVHRPEVVAQIVTDLKAQGPDHILVSGDLTNLGLPAEHKRALEFLRALGSPETVSAVPGNHDVYTRHLFDASIGHWAEYAGSVGEGRWFPLVREIGPVTLIGLNSAILTMPGIAAGHVDARQLERMIAALNDAGERGRFRLVMVHHPPLPGQAGPRRALRNAAELAMLLTHHGAELVVHGHNHRFMMDWVAGPGGAFPVIGAPSCSVAEVGAKEDIASYHLFTISGAPDTGYGLRFERRGLNAAGGEVVSLGVEEFATPDPQRTATYRAPAA